MRRWDPAGEQLLSLGSEWLLVVATRGGSVENALGMRSRSSAFSFPDGNDLYPVGTRLVYQESEMCQIYESAESEKTRQNLSKSAD